MTAVSTSSPKSPADEAPAAPCVAIPFTAWPPEKFATVVTKAQEFRPWFDDALWDAGDLARREAVIARLSDPATRVWEVWRGSELVGILVLSAIVPGRDALGHFLFFDRELRDKRALCRNFMRWAFEQGGLHVLRVEVPTFAAKLTGFLRKALHFRFEAERRPFSWPKDAAPIDADAAKLGSRKHHAIRHNGVWYDTLLLSVTDDEFRASESELGRSISRINEPTSGD